jgi:hypothetical protein
MSVRSLAAVGLLAALAPRPALAYGEPDAEGVPDRRERLLHVLSNQIRQEPHAWPDWDTSLATPEPRRPLALEQRLFGSARFHADDMATTPCFQHESCDGTSFQDRLSRFFPGAAGENIYKASGDASPRSALVGWMNSAGHRRNLLDPDWRLLGTGFARGGSWVYYVQNFGSPASGASPLVPGAAVEELGGGRYRALANFHDVDGAGPAELAAVVDGTQYPLARIAGRPENQTASAELTLAGCAEVFFRAVSAGGEAVRFPDRGALLAGPECEADYRAEPARGGSGGRTVIEADPAGGCRCVPASRAQAPGALILGLLAAVALLRPRTRAR